jgi:hypothetical protein
MVKTIQKKILIMSICLVGVFFGCGNGDDTPDVSGTINSVSAKGIVADALVMSRLASAGASAGYFTEHDPDLSSCDTGNTIVVANNSDILSLIYNACKTGAVTWDGRIEMSAETKWPYNVEFGDTSNSLRISQSEPTITFPYLDSGQLLTLKGDMQVRDSANGYQYLMQDLNIYYNTCDMELLNAELYIGYINQGQDQEVLFQGEVRSNLVPDIECHTTRRFIAQEQSYPYEGTMLVTALDDGSNVFVVANADASTVNLRIDTDNNSIIDSETSTTWEDLKNSADPYLQDLFEFFWKN